MKTKIITLLFAATLALGACQNGQSPFGDMGTKQMIGTGGGAVLGGLAGSALGHGTGRLWTTGAGALLGAFAGSSIGQSLDRADMQYNQQATEKAYSAPLNDTVNWNNPDNGHSGSITPVKEGREAASGNLCRQYKQTIVVDGKSQTAYGTACQESDGTWTIKNSD